MIRLLPVLSFAALVFLFSSCDKSKHHKMKGEISRTTVCENPRKDVVVAEDGVHFQSGPTEVSFESPEPGQKMSLWSSSSVKVSPNKDASFFFDEKTMTLYVFESREVIMAVEVIPPKPGEQFGSTRSFSFKSKMCSSGKKE